jgi:hypothetical protein
MATLRVLTTILVLLGWRASSVTIRNCRDIGNARWRDPWHGMFTLDQNPAIGGHNAALVQPPTNDRGRLAGMHRERIQKAGDELGSLYDSADSQWIATSVGLAATDLPARIARMVLVSCPFRRAFGGRVQSV